MAAHFSSKKAQRSTSYSQIATHFRSDCEQMSTMRDRADQPIQSSSMLRISGHRFSEKIMLEQGDEIMIGIAPIES